MRSHELPDSPETQRPKLDALIVLGENIKKGWGPKEIRQDPLQLSPYSKANALAAAILYLQGATDTFIFSTGRTAGKSVPSEAEAMQAYFGRITRQILETRRKNPHLKDLWSNRSFSPIIILEERSLNTAGNAREVVKTIKEESISSNTFGLLAPSFHIKRAEMHFRRHGIEATVFTTDDILEAVMPGIKDNFMNPEMLAQELKREKIIATIEKLPLGTLVTGSLSRLTRR